MIDYSLLTVDVSPAVEADLADWVEQHRTVTFPDEDYPHLDKL